MSMREMGKDHIPLKHSCLLTRAGFALMPRGHLMAMEGMLEYYDALYCKGI